MKQKSSINSSNAKFKAREHQINHFANGRRNQNNILTSQSNEMVPTQVETSEEQELQNGNDVQNKSEILLNKKRRKRSRKEESNYNANKRKAKCWNYFNTIEKINNQTNQKEMYDVCNIVEKEKKCGYTLVHFSSTTRKNDHLYEAHKLEEFKPTKAVDRINISYSLNCLFAKFIISTGLAFSVLDNEWLKILCDRLDFDLFKKREMLALINNMYNEIKTNIIGNQ
jgi:hypothetical protein